MIDTKDLSPHAKTDPRQLNYEIARREFQANPLQGYPRVIKKMENRDR